MEIRFLTKRLRTLLESETGVTIPKSAIYAEITSGLLLDSRLRTVDSLAPDLDNHSILPNHVDQIKLLELLVTTQPTVLEYIQEHILKAITNIVVYIESYYSVISKHLSKKIDNLIRSKYSSLRDRIIDYVSDDFENKYIHNPVFRTLLPVLDKVMNYKYVPVVKTIFKSIVSKKKDK